MVEKVETNINQIKQGNIIDDSLIDSDLSFIDWQFHELSSFVKESMDNNNQEADGLQQIISDTSHQLKTPLANILIYSELMEELLKDKPEYTYAKNIVSQTNKLKNLIDQLTLTSRLESKMIQLDIKPYDITCLIHEVMVLYERQAFTKNITIKTASIGKRMVLCDYKWTMEAIGNIVDNGIKYSDKGGTLVIDSKVYELYIQIDIKTKGRSVPRDEQTLLFNRFYRGVENDENEGVGLGLYISQQIAIAQGGYVTMTSEYDENCFSFLLLLDN